MKEIGKPNSDERLAAEVHRDRINGLFRKHQGFVDTYETPEARTESVSLNKQTEKDDIHFTAQRVSLIEEGKLKQGSKALIVHTTNADEVNTSLYVGPSKDGAIHKIDIDMESILADSAIPTPGEVSERVLFDISADLKGKEEEKVDSESRVGLQEMTDVLKLAEEAEVTPVSFAELEFIHENRLQGLEPTSEESQAAAKEFTGYVKDVLKRRGYYFESEQIKRIKERKRNEAGDILDIKFGILFDNSVSVPFVTVECDREIDGMQVRHTLGYAINDEGHLINKKLTGVYSGGVPIGEEEDTVLADSLEANKVRNFLNDPKFI